MLELASACLCHRPTTSLWICYQQFGTPFMLTGLSSPDKYSKFRPFAAPRWTLTEGPRITLAPLPCVWHGLQRRFESLNHCSQPKFGPWNSGFLQIDSTLNSVPMAAATNPIRSSSHVEAKPSMPVVSKKHAKRREKNQKIDRLSELPTWEGCSGATSIGLSSSKPLCCILHLQGRDI